MKLLIESYEIIVGNWLEKENTTEKDLAHALHEFTTTVVKKNDLLPIVSVAKRTFCENDCDTDYNMEFTKINGSFCKKCGYIYPF